MTTPDTLELRIERVRQMIVDCEAEPEMPMMLAASICKEHASDLRALLDRVEALEAPGVWWKTVIGEGDAHQPSGEIRSIKHIHPLMVKPFYDAHKGDAIGDIIAGLIFNLEITQNRETFLVEDANERRKSAEDALEGREAWQPIETAPRDGTWITAWRTPPSWTGPTWEPMIYVRWDDDEGSWVWPDGMYQVFTIRGRELADMAIDEGDFFAADNFTHWRPLPEAPTPPKEKTQ